MYAIVDISGQQMKVEKDQKIYVNRLKDKEGSKIELDKVILIDNNGKVKVGSPTVDGAMVSAKVLDHVKGDKVKVFKKKRRKGYKKLNGHRQYLTSLLIEDILESGAKKKVEAKKEEAPKEAETKNAEVKSETKTESADVKAKSSTTKTKSTAATTKKSTSASSKGKASGSKSTPSQTKKTTSAGAKKSGTAGTAKKSTSSTTKKATSQKTAGKSTGGDASKKDDGNKKTDQDNSKKEE